MSTLEYNYNPSQPLTEADIRRIAREENFGRKTEVWHNPVTDNFHKVPQGIVPYGARIVDNDTINDIWRETPVIANRRIAIEGNKRLSAGSLNADSATYMPYRTEFQDKALRFNELREKLARGEIGQREAAGIIANSDYQDIAEQVLSNEIFDLTYLEYVLEGAVTQKTSQTLKVALPGRIGSAKPWAKGLKEFDIPDSHNIAYQFAEMALEKMAARFEISTWFDLTTRRFNVEADTNRQITNDQPRVYDEEIRAKLATFTDTAAGTAWTAVTSGVSNIDPTIVLETVLTNISLAGGRANTAVMHPSTFNAMTGNTFMRPAGLINLQSQISPAQASDQIGGTRRHEKVPDLQIFTSRNVPVGSMYVYDKRTLELYKGPSRVGNYEDILGSYRGTLREQWYGSTVVEATWGREITGINT